MADLREQTDMTKRTCKFGDGKPVVGKDMCRKHYSRDWRHGDPLYGEDVLPRGTMGVYSITCAANGWVYIGSSSSVRGRWTTHKSWLRNGTHTIPQMQADYDAHGPESFIYEMVSVVADQEARLTCEQEHITAAIATGKCYNLSPSARNNGGHRFNPDQSARLSAALTGKAKSAEHRANLWRDREVTGEIRDLMAANGRRGAGKPKPAEQRRKMSEAQLGGRTVLTEADVREIKRLLAVEPDDPAKLTGGEIARRFNITRGAVSAIRTGRNWSHVTLDDPEPAPPGLLF